VVASNSHVHNGAFCTIAGAAISFDHVPIVTLLAHIQDAVAAKPRYDGAKHEKQLTAQHGPHCHDHK
jgi:hypothetical protein